MCSLLVYFLIVLGTIQLVFSIRQRYTGAPGPRLLQTPLKSDVRLETNLMLQVHSNSSDLPKIYSPLA